MTLANNALDHFVTHENCCFNHLDLKLVYVFYWPYVIHEKALEDLVQWHPDIYPTTSIELFPFYQKFFLKKKQNKTADDELNWIIAFQTAV